MTTGTTLALAYLACLLAAFVARLFFRRKDAMRIRDWARKNGYAVLHLQYRWSPLFVAIYLFTQLPLLCPFPMTGDWHVKIQDEQGGLRQVEVHFGNMLVDIPGGEMKFERR